MVLIELCLQLHPDVIRIGVAYVIASLCSSIADTNRVGLLF